MLTRFSWISNKNLFATIFFRTEFELERIVNVKIWSRENIDSPFEVSRSQKSTVFTRIRSKIQASGVYTASPSRRPIQDVTQYFSKVSIPSRNFSYRWIYKKFRKQYHKDYMEERLIQKIIYIFPLNDNE